MTGRFQPVHAGHLELFSRVLQERERLLVAVTNPDPAARTRHPDHDTRHLAESNPFTFYQRFHMITAALSDSGVRRERYDIVPFPLHDPERVAGYVPVGVTQYVRVFSPWEGAKAKMLRRYGYPVVEIDGDPSERISSSDIRSAMAAGSPWQQFVTPGVAEQIEAALSGKTPVRPRAPGR